MNRFERVMASLNNREPDIIPLNPKCMDINAYHKFIPKFDSYNWKKNEMEYIEFVDNYIVEGGHRELKSKVIEREDNYHIIEFENGARWKIYR